MKYLIVGLGNVGDEYAHTRHNIGFDIVMGFVLTHGGQLRPDRLAYQADIRWKGRIFICICPTTFMNLSGKAVKYWMEKENIEIQNMLVLVDDLALPLSKIRLRRAGSDAGHNGLKSIQETLGTVEDPTLRCRSGNDFSKGHQTEFVLGQWKKDEQPIVQEKIKRCIEVIENFATTGMAATMNKYNNIEITL
ncbi:MAG: aminoacyl-tRNA hydrolase [Flavisolibacter sp.]